MLMWLALVAQLFAPQPQYMWFSNDDTPVKEIGNRDFARVKLRLTIPPDGRVHACEIEETSGNPHLDLYTCELTRRRALFTPAKNVEGANTYGVYRIPVVWTKGPVSLPPTGDLIVSIREPTHGPQLPTIVHVMFAVDKTGRIQECGGEPPSFESPDRNSPILVPVACEQLKGEFHPQPAKDDQGTSVESVQDAVVVFVKS
jgi:hypothetical protein